MTLYVGRDAVSGDMARAAADADEQGKDALEADLPVCDRLYHACTE